MPFNAETLIEGRFAVSLFDWKFNWISHFSVESECHAKIAYCLKYRRQESRESNTKSFIGWFPSNAARQHLTTTGSGEQWEKAFRAATKSESFREFLSTVRTCVNVIECLGGYFSGWLRLKNNKNASLWNERRMKSLVETKQPDASHISICCLRQASEKEQESQKKCWGCLVVMSSWVF